MADQPVLLTQEARLAAERFQRPGNLPIHRLERAIRAEWCAETAWAPVTWSDASSARGQCFSTSYVVQSLLGGTIIHAEVLPQRSPREGHSWNRLADGTEIDLTREQFTLGETFRPHHFPDDLVWGAAGTQAELLLERVEARLKAEAARRFHGSGPGVQSADGCSVDFYRQLSDAGDLSEVERFIARGARLLELGCGTGRLTRRMLELGASVVAVDNSAEMLDHVPADAQRVQSEIEVLDLPDRFDLVVLASSLINHPDIAVRNAFVASAQRHLRLGGQFLVQRTDPDWLLAARVGQIGTSGDVLLEVEEAAHQEQRASITLRYEIGASSWRHSFQAVALSQNDIESLLAKASFGQFEWSASGRWVVGKLR